MLLCICWREIEDIGYLYVSIGCSPQSQQWGGDLDQSTGGAFDGGVDLQAYVVVNNRG
jgi:hypothetical protein